MRNALARLVGANSQKPSWRDRLTATREKYARSLRVHRALNLPVAEPAPDRVALVNYAKWLHMERTSVCAELYPGMGRRCTAFVLTLNAAERFFYPDGIGAPNSKAHLRVPPASTRAVKILDMVGVAWRNDLNDSARQHFASGENPERQLWLYKEPRPPHGWPAPDATLLEALDDVNRLDSAIDAILGGCPEREPDDVPGYAALSGARDAAVDRLASERAESLTGLQVKAKALLVRSIDEQGGEPRHALASSLSSDLLQAAPAMIDRRPDPIFAVIEEAHRLNDAWTATNALPEVPGTLDRPPEALKAQDAFHGHIRDVLLTTVPTTAEGCKALASYVGKFQAREGFALDEADGGQNVRVLALIARSPLL